MPLLYEELLSLLLLFTLKCQVLSFLNILLYKIFTVHVSLN